MPDGTVQPYRDASDIRHATATASGSGEWPAKSSHDSAIPCSAKKARIQSRCEPGVARNIRREFGTRPTAQSRRFIQLTGAICRDPQHVRISDDDVAFPKPARSLSIGTATRRPSPTNTPGRTVTATSRQPSRRINAERQLDATFIGMQSTDQCPSFRNFRDTNAAAKLVQSYFPQTPEWWPCAGFVALAAFRRAVALFLRGAISSRGRRAANGACAQFRCS